MNSKIVSENIIINSIDNEYIEKYLSENYGTIIRWAVTDYAPNGCIISFSYRK